MYCIPSALFWRSVSLSLGSTAVYCGFTATAAFAQSITAAGDGTGTQVQHQGDTFNISGGTQAGANQFHSFEQFGLEQQQTANFQTEAGTANVLGRVTGGDPSVINGTVQVTGSEANLYLMNPAGMVFGDNARLDVPGSFHGTTADSIGFEGGEFSANGQNTYENLGGAPSRFNFEGGSNGAIVNQGNLAVTEGKNLSLTGSTVINTGTLTAPGGQAAVIAAPTDRGSQSVRITQNGMVMELEVGADRLRQQNLNAADLTRNPAILPKVLTGGTVDHATDLQVVNGRVYLSGSGMAIDPLTGSAAVAGTATAGQVLVQADRVQVTGATLEATSQGSSRSQIEILGIQNSQVQDSQLNLSNLVGIGGLLAIEADTVAVRGSTIAANGLQGGGVVQLQASQGLSYVENSTITVMSSQGSGGRVEVLGDRVEILGSTIDASGVAGGEIYIGGDYQGGGTRQTAQETFVDAGSLLRAEGLGWNPTGSPLPSPEVPNALGGRVIVWADDRTRFYGALKAKGAAEFSDSGFAEVSGKVSLDLGDRWDQRIRVGELLLDPTNIAIVSGTGTYGATTISNFLNHTGDLILTTDIGGTEGGDITVRGAITWNSGYSLTLRANRAIYLISDLMNAGTGSIMLEAQTLSVGQAVPFANHSFEADAVGSTSIAGWQISVSQVQLGQTEIGGFTSPADPGASYGRFIGDNYTYTGPFAVGVVADDSGGADNTRSVRLASVGGWCNAGYCNIHGPYIVSEGSSYLTEGDQVSFDWKALDGGDDYDVYGYLLNTETGATIELLDSRGNATRWQTNTTVLPIGTPAGHYKFVFVGGSYDASGGEYLGASFLIDNIITGLSTSVPQYRLQAGGGLHLLGNLQLSRDLALDATLGGTITLGNVTGHGQTLTLNTSGTTVLVGNLSGLNLITDGVGYLQISGSLSTVSALNLGEDLNLVGNTVLDSGNASLTLVGTVNGPYSLTLNSTGLTSLLAPIGESTPLTSLTTNAGGSTTVWANISTTGRQVFNDALTVVRSPAVNPESSIPSISETPQAVPLSGDLSPDNGPVTSLPALLLERIDTLSNRAPQIIASLSNIENLGGGVENSSFSLAGGSLTGSIEAETDSLLAKANPGEGDRNSDNAGNSADLSNRAASSTPDRASSPNTSADSATSDGANNPSTEAGYEASGAGSGSGSAVAMNPAENPGSTAEAAANAASPEAVGSPALPDPTTATGSDGEGNLPDPNGPAQGDGSAGSGENLPDLTMVAGGSSLGGTAAAGDGEIDKGLAIVAAVVAGLTTVGGAAAIATGAAQGALAGLQGLMSGGGASAGAAGGAGAGSGAGGAGAPGLLVGVAAVVGTSQAQQYLSQLKVALEPRVESQFKVSLNKQEGASLTGGAMALMDQSIWENVSPEVATEGLPGLGELLGVESSGPEIEGKEPDATGLEASEGGDLGVTPGQGGRITAVKAKIAEAVTAAGIPEEAIEALYTVAIEKIGEFLSEIDLAEGILGEAWGKVFEIMEYRALLAHIQANGAIMIPLMTHEILAEQSPSIDLKFQETPVGTFEVKFSLGIVVNGATLAIENQKLTHVHLGSVALVGGIEFAGLPLFEAPEAGLEINRIIRLGNGIVIKLPTA